MATKASTGKSEESGLTRPKQTLRFPSSSAFRTHQERCIVPRWRTKETATGWISESIEGETNDTGDSCKVLIQGKKCGAVFQDDLPTKCLSPVP